MNALQEIVSQDYVEEEALLHYIVDNIQADDGMKRYFIMPTTWYLRNVGERSSTTRPAKKEATIETVKARLKARRSYFVAQLSMRWTIVPIKVRVQNASNVRSMEAEVED